MANEKYNAIVNELDDFLLESSEFCELLKEYEEIKFREMGYTDIIEIEELPEGERFELYTKIRDEFIKVVFMKFTLING